jgi:hypothetical protein
VVGSWSVGVVAAPALSAYAGRGSAAATFLSFIWRRSRPVGDCVVALDIFFCPDVPGPKP